MTPRNSHRLRLLIGLGLILAVLVLPVVVTAQGTDPQTGGYYLAVQRGDTWSVVSERTGVSVADLMAANPTAVHPNGWMWVGDRLFIPGSSTPTPQPANTATAVAVSATPGTVSAAVAATPAAEGYWYEVKSGDTWYTVSRDTGVSILDLWHANPDVKRPHEWLWVGDRVFVPGHQKEGSGTPTPTPTADLTPTSEPTASPTNTSVASSAITPTEMVKSPTPTTQPTSTPMPTVTPMPTLAKPTALPSDAVAPKSGKFGACLKDFAAYPNGISAFLNSSGHKVTDLAPWLTDCGALGENLGGVFPVSIQRSESADIVVALHDPAAGAQSPRGTLLVYFAGAHGYVLAGQADGTGKIDVLQIGDVNADQKPDIVWTDTSCGAHTCFSTLFVYSWDGTAFRDWIEGEPTMAGASYTITNTVSGGSGNAILAHGGLVDSAGAGSQRPWTETYISPEGGPYRLLIQEFDKSTCMYFRIVDANKLFDDWTKTGFSPAIAAYQAVIQDTSLTACGTIADEVNVLRDFARFRVIVSLVGSGKPAQAAKIKDDIKTAAMTGAAGAFIESYTSSHSIVQACRDTTAYAQDHPDTWQFLADWGYANPSFTADDLCPLAK